MYSSSFIYLFTRERERDKIFRVLCSVKWLELAPFEHDFSCSNFSCLYMKMCNVHFSFTFLRLWTAAYQKVQERGSVSIVFKIWTSA